eukprot:3214315-Pyramimonas_sp.AAC.1
MSNMMRHMSMRRGKMRSKRSGRRRMRNRKRRGRHEERSTIRGGRGNDVGPSILILAVSPWTDLGRSRALGRVWKWCVFGPRFLGSGNFQEHASDSRAQGSIRAAIVDVGVGADRTPHRRC